MVSVTVNWNLYIPDVRLDTIIWSLKPVFYMKTTTKIGYHLDASLSENSTAN